MDAASLAETTPALTKRRKTMDPLARPPLTHMREVSRQEYVEFVRTHPQVEVEGVAIPLHTEPATITATGPDPAYLPESSTVWSFPERGEWATHKGNYRGNWSPYIPHNLIRKYTKPGELVLDQMCGSGTTLVEAKLLGRDAIGVDVNPDAVMVTQDRLNFVPTQKLVRTKDQHPPGKIRVFVGDARNLDQIQDGTVDLVATHPPYAGIIAYTGARVTGDISALRLKDFFEGIRQVAKEALRVLKPGKYCAVLIGDTRQRRHYVPISTRILQVFLESGFVLKEDIIKVQHKMKGTRENWKGAKYDFYLIAHEHLFVFRKLGVGESTSNFRNSTDWTGLKSPP